MVLKLFPGGRHILKATLTAVLIAAAFYKDSIADKLAILIISTIMKTKPNYAIDLHTDSAHSIPYIIVDLPGSIKNNKIIARSISLAKKLGFFWAIETEESSGYPLEKSLSGQLLCRDIPAVTIELGGPLLIINKFRKMGLEAVWSFLYKQKMVDFSSSEKNIVQTFDSKHKVYGFYYRARTNSTGIIEYRIKPGQFIKKDMVIGKIRNVFGEIIEVMRSPVNGILLSHEDQSVTFPGQSLFTIAVESSMKFSQ